MHRFCFKKQRNFNIFPLWGSLGALWSSLGLSGALWGSLGLSGALWGFRYNYYPIWEGRATHFLCIYFCFCFKNKPSYAVSTHFLRIFHWTVEPLNRWKPLNNWIVEPLNRWTVEPLNNWIVEPLNRWTMSRQRPGNVQATSLNRVVYLVVVALSKADWMLQVHVLCLVVLVNKGSLQAACRTHLRFLHMKRTEGQ